MCVAGQAVGIWAPASAAAATRQGELPAHRPDLLPEPARDGE